jgi:excinuclease ABC subunit C
MRESSEQQNGVPPFDFKAELKNLPVLPGVYRMYDAKGQVIYIGKAKVLRNRVRSYFLKNGGHSPKTRMMLPLITRFNYIVTNSEVEALILEDSLIKQHQPKYNILLKDDKRFPWIGVSDEAYPRLFMARSTRKPKGRNVRFFGPYTNTSEMFTLLRLLQKYFPLRKRPVPLFKDRPCMNYHLGLCAGPCQGLISPQGYQEIVNQAVMVLKGHTRDLEHTLETKMQQASEALQFERAQEIHERLKAVQRLGQKQIIVSEDHTRHQDIVALAHDAYQASIVVLVVRYGRIVASKPFVLSMHHEAVPEEVYNSFLLQYYRSLEKDELPDELILQFPVQDEDVVQAWLSTVHGKKVSFYYPQKGKKEELLQLAQVNAKTGLEQAQLYEATKLKNDPVKAVLDLQTHLGLERYPRRMECYDISHFQGSQTVASMTVFIDGQPARDEYRRFKVRIAEGKPDDFASMHEVLTRRSRHRDDWPEPDLLIIDGGKGQLSAAQRAVQEQQWAHIPMVSLAKRFEEIFPAWQPHAIVLPHSTPALQVVQRIRDEAHRFAITYHRTLRGKKALKHPLDGVPGIGDKRKADLMNAFTTWQEMVEASPETLMQALGWPSNTAQRIYAAIQEKQRSMQQSISSALTNNPSPAEKKALPAELEEL